MTILLIILGIFVALWLITLPFRLWATHYRRAGKKAWRKSERERKANERSVSKYADQYSSSSFLREVLERIQNGSSGMTVHSVVITGQNVEYFVMQLDSRGYAVTNESGGIALTKKEFSFRDMGYQSISDDWQLRGFATALRKKLPNDYEEFINHVDLVGAPAIENIQLKYSGTIKLHHPDEGLKSTI